MILFINGEKGYLAIPGPIWKWISPEPAGVALLTPRTANVFARVFHITVEEVLLVHTEMKWNVNFPKSSPFAYFLKSFGYH